GGGKPKSAVDARNRVRRIDHCCSVGGRARNRNDRSKMGEPREVSVNDELEEDRTRIPHANEAEHRRTVAAELMILVQGAVQRPGWHPGIEVCWKHKIAG